MPVSAFLETNSTSLVNSCEYTLIRTVVPFYVPVRASRIGQCAGRDSDPSGSPTRAVCSSARGPCGQVGGSSGQRARLGHQRVAVRVDQMSQVVSLQQDQRGGAFVADVPDQVVDHCQQVV